MATARDLPTTKIIDFNAVIKHCYFIGQDPDAIIDPDTGVSVNTWKHGAAKLLERYRDSLFDEETLFPRRTYICHDDKSVFRTGLFPEYKAKRRQKALDEEGTAQKEEILKFKNWAVKFFVALGCTQVGVEGVEADDIIAWVVQALKDEVVEIFTVDSDLAVLCQNPDVIVHLLLEPIHYDLGGYKDVPFELLTLYKSLVGDTSDEYPGIRGFGPAAWGKLVAAIGEEGCKQLATSADHNDRSILNALLSTANSKELSKIDENFSEWRKMWRLAKLHPELCWMPRAGKLTVPKIHKRIPNLAQMKALLEEADLGMDLIRFEAIFPNQYGIDASHWENEGFVKDVFNEVAAGDVTAFDYETADRDPVPGFIAGARRGKYVDMNQHTLTGAGFCFGRHLENVIYLSVDHANTRNAPKEAIVELLDRCYDNTQLVVHNRYFEETITRREFGASLGDTHDTQVLLRLVNENLAFGLKAAAMDLLGYKMVSYEDTTQGRRMDELTLEEVLSYGCDDPLATAHLYDLLVFMAKLDGCWERYQQAWVRPAEVLSDSHIKGVRLNLPLLRRIHQQDIADLGKNMDRLREILASKCTGDNIDYTGAKAFAESEREYVEKSARAKLKAKCEKAREKGNDVPDPTIEELKAASRQAFEDFQVKALRAAEYRPLEIRHEMPRFAYTANQLTAAAEALGLPPIEKVSKKAITEWLEEQGAYQVGGADALNPAQREFVSRLADAHEADMSRLKKITNQILGRSLDDSPEDAAFVEEFETITRAFNRLAKVAQQAAGVQPREIRTGDELNIGSPVQVPQIVYCKLGVPVEQRNKASLGRIKLGLAEGSPAGNEKALLWAIANHCSDDDEKREALECLIAAKRCRTKISLYHTKWPLWVHPKDGLVHPSFLLAGTDTRRPTGSAPNTLQVSKKDPVMRDCFMAPDRDMVVVAVDFNGQELRIIANESKDPEMLRAYDPKDERCIHSTTGVGIARLMSGVDDQLKTYEGLVSARKNPDHPLHKQAEDIRKKGKGTNFALTYGAAAPTVSISLVVPVTDAELFLNGAHSVYKRIKPWQDETAAFMDAHGYTINAFGTKRHATEDLFSRDKSKVARQHRQGTNATIQGCAAEMLADILTEIAKRNLLGRLRMVFFAPIYDEVVAFVHRDDVAEYCREIHDIMSNVAPASHVVPQVPEFSIGPVWGSLTELGRYPESGADEFFTNAATEAWEELQVIYDRFEDEIGEYQEPEEVAAQREAAEKLLAEKGAALSGDVNQYDDDYVEGEEGEDELSEQSEEAA